MFMKQKIAIIGGGIAGLTAGYLLNLHHDIRLYEKSGRLGGNACTHRTQNGEILDIAVGSVMGRVAKNFLTLCRMAHVPMVRQPTASLISYHDLETKGGFYPTFLSVRGIIDQKFGLVRKSPALIRILFLIRQCVALLDKGELNGVTVESMFDILPSTTSFERHVIMAAFCTMSCMTYEDVLSGPAEYYVEKMKAHGNYNPLLVMKENVFPRHYTQSYVDAFSSGYTKKVIFNADIRTVRRDSKGVMVCMKDGSENRFDKVVFACHPDQALALIDNPTTLEKNLLGAWAYKDVPVVVHRDDTSAPKRSLCQPWTCIQSPKNGRPHFSISYCTWLLSPAVPNKSPYFSTQHATIPIREDMVDARKQFRAPCYDFKSLATLPDLPSLNGQNHSYFCGSYFGRGLHGDAVDSAIRVASQLGVDWTDKEV